MSFVRCGVCRTVVRRRGQGQLTDVLRDMFQPLVVAPWFTVDVSSGMQSPMDCCLEQMSLQALGELASLLRGLGWRAVIRQAQLPWSQG